MTRTLHRYRFELALGLLVLLAALAGCANLITGEPPVKPENAGETTVLAGSVIEKAVQTQRILLRRGLISSTTAQTILDSAKATRAAWDAAQQALALGDLDTALAKLQAAQASLDFLNAWLARHATVEGTNG